MQRYFAKERLNDVFILNDTDLRHIRLVMRMKDNDEVEVVLDNKVYLCCIENVKSNIKIKLKKEIKNKTNVFYNVTLIVPVLKEQKMDYILQKSTELGVSKIIPVLTERTIIKLNNKDSIKKKERWNKIVKEASEQSKRNDIPIIDDIIYLKDLKQMSGISITCSTVEKKNTIKKVFSNVEKCANINIVIGPEGGLSNKEEKFLNEIGFISTTFGSRILRVETVPLFLLSILNYIYME